LQSLPEVLRQQHVDPDRFLAGYGLSADALLAPNHYITYWLYSDVLHGAASACRTPHLGLLLSQADTHLLHARGTLGVLLQYCETVGDALEAMIRYYHVVSGGASYELRREGDQALLIREGLVAGLKHDRILQDLSLSDLVAALRRAIGRNWNPVKVLFSYDEPDDCAPYERFLRCPIEFNAGIQAVCFAAHDSNQEIRISDSLREELLRDLVSRSLFRSERSLTEAVSQVIDVLLPTGICCVNSVAGIFNVHSRTLHRQLKREGITFARILEERRKAHATSYLTSTTMTSAEIALALGYAAPEVFTRAFRKWYGQSPNAWRNRPE
jgi:AraC-like DNA-binding protein